MYFNGKERKIETKALTNGTPKVRIAKDMAGKAGWVWTANEDTEKYAVFF